MSKKTLYNEETKQEYLSTIQHDEVKELVLYVFSKSKSAEEKYKKDLHSFDLDQIDMVMKNINPSTMNSVANNKSMINIYIRWAIKNGRRANNINPLQGTGRDWALKFIDKVKKRHFSSSELDTLLGNLYNDQDKALVQCIFEGISGYRMSELISMKTSDIDWQTREITVYDSKKDDHRIVQVSKKCLEYIESAYKQSYYIAELTNNEKELLEYEESIFKNTFWRSTRNDFVSSGTLLKRLSAIKEKYRLDEFSVTTISESGRIKMAADIFIEKRKVDKEGLTLIGDTFSLPTIVSNGYEYYNTTVMKNYISTRNLKQLYNIEVIM